MSEQNHAARIESAVAELNDAIGAARRDGLHIHTEFNKYVADDMDAGTTLIAVSVRQPMKVGDR